MPILDPRISGQAADQSVRDLRMADIDPGRVTIEESRALIACCKGIVKKLQAKIRQERKRGRHRIARRYQTELWEGLPARLVAASEGYRKIEARRRRAMLAPTPPERVYLAISNLAERLKNVHAPSTAFRRIKQKPKGGYREFYEFNAFGIAKQKLFVNAIEPFASFHPSQFSLPRRGRTAACGNLLNTTNRPLLRNTPFLQFDLNDFDP